MALAELEVVLGISNRLLDNHEDLFTFLQQFTKAIAEIPFRYCQILTFFFVHIHPLVLKSKLKFGVPILYIGSKTSVYF